MAFRSRGSVAVVRVYVAVVRVYVMVARVYVVMGVWPFDSFDDTQARGGGRRRRRHGRRRRKGRAIELSRTTSYS